MTEIILHHYDFSTFSEKIRRILAYKNIKWYAVEQPMMAPKPELIPLTGGYRRIPVMQIGADIYCDTKLIARRLEQLFPEPKVIPPELEGIISLIEDWSDHHFFMQVVPPVVVELFDDLPPGFLEDREAMSPHFSRESFINSVNSIERVEHRLNDLDRQLTGNDYLLKNQFTLADAACYHILNLLKNNNSTGASMIRNLKALSAWLERIENFGPGNVHAMETSTALDIARSAQPLDIPESPSAFQAAAFSFGDKITIVADDYGREEISGTLIQISSSEVVISRNDNSVGTVAVHFPREGYLLTHSEE